MVDAFSWMSVPEFTRLLPTDGVIIAYDRHLCNADNVTLNAGSGGAVLATDDIGPGVHYQIIKLAHGALDTATLVSVSGGLPVDLRQNNLAGDINVNLAAAAATVTVTGTVTANVGTGTMTTQDTASLVDDAAFSPGASRVLPSGYTFDDVTPDSVNEGDIGVARMSANRNIYTQLRDAAGNERGANVTAGGALNVAVDSLPALAAGTNNIGDVDVLSLPALPTGANTIGNVGVVSLPALVAGTANIGDVDVLSLPALPAGNNNIGDVDIASITVGAIIEVQGDVAHDAAAAGNPVLLGAYASAAAPADVSADADAVRLWALRNGAQVINVSAAGALIGGDATNGLDVDVTRVTGTVTVAGAVTNTVLSVVGGGAEATAQRVTIANDSTGVLSVDDNGASLTVDGTVTANAGTGTFAVSHSTLAVVGTGTEATALRVTIATDSTGVLSIDDNGGTLTVDGTVTANAGSGTFTVAGAVTNTVLSVVGGGTEATAQRVTIANDSTGLLSVDDNGGSLTVDGTVTANAGTGTFTVSGTVAISSLPNEAQQTMANSISVAVASDQTNVPVSQATASALNAQVVGNIAHDSADSGPPVKVGGVARTANPTAVTAGDRVDLYMDKLGRPVVTPIAPRERVISSGRISLTTTSETTLVAAGAAGVFRDMVMLMLSNESATECRVDIRDVTAGTIVLSMDLAGDGGGMVAPFRLGFPQTTAASAWSIQLSAAVSTVYATALFAETT